MAPARQRKKASQVSLVKFGLMTRNVPTPAAIRQDARFLRGGARISKGGLLFLSKKQMEAANRANLAHSKARAARVNLFKRVLLSEGKQELLGRMERYGDLLNFEPTKRLIYSVEKRGLGREFVPMTGTIRKEEFKKLVSIRDTERAFLKTLEIAGGIRVSNVLEIAGGKAVGLVLNGVDGLNFGDALKAAGGRIIGQAFNIVAKRTGDNFDVAGVRRFIESLNAAGGKAFGNALDRDFDRTVENIKRTSRI